MRQALEIAIDYMNERLEDHDVKYKRHPATEAERINILADIETVKEALAQPEQFPFKQLEEELTKIAELQDHIRLLEKQLAQPEQEPVAWVPYLSDRADGVKGHYAIARWNPRGYREVWNLRRHEWGAYSDDVLSLEEADTLLRLITIPTRKVTSPQPPQRKPLPYEKVVDLWLARFDTNEYDEVFMNFARAIEAAHGIKE